MFENPPRCANSRDTDGVDEIPQQRPRCLLVIAMMLTTPVGCSMYHAGFENLVAAPSQFRIHHDQTATERHHRQIAREALAKRHAARPKRQFTKDYVAGFEQGFVDYLTNGGSTAPPILPPRTYWNLSQRSGTEHEAAQDWLNGATDGRNHAAESGLRDLAVVPSTVAMSEDEQVFSASDQPESLPAPARPVLAPEDAMNRNDRRILGKARLTDSP